MKTLCTKLVCVAEAHPNLLQQARQVIDRFKQAFSLFGKCHNAYNGGVMDDTAIDQLGKSENYAKNVYS